MAAPKHKRPEFPPIVFGSQAERLIIGAAMLVAMGFVLHLAHTLWQVH